MEFRGIMKGEVKYKKAGLFLTRLLIGAAI
jgi:hypothetical protein